MKNYKAFYIISALTDEELVLFESFLKSPYHNTRKKPVELFRLIKKNKKKPEISKQKIFEKLYPGKVFNSNTFNDLMAQLYKLVEEFLFSESVKKDRLKKEVELLGSFLDGRFSSLFKSKKKQIDKLIENIKTIDSFFFWNIFLKEAYTTAYLQSYTNIRTKKDILGITECLNKATINITNLYLEEIMATFLHTKTKRLELGNSTFPKLMRSVTAKVFDNSFLNLFEKKNKYHYYVKFSKYIFDLYFSDGDIKVYSEYRKSLNRHQKNLSHGHMCYQYTYLIGYCVRQVTINPQSAFFRKEMYSVFDETLRKNIIVIPKIVISGLNYTAVYWEHF